MQVRILPDVPFTFQFILTKEVVNSSLRSVSLCGIDLKTHTGVAQWIERFSAKEVAAGSTPATGISDRIAVSFMPGGAIG